MVGEHIGGNVDDHGAVIFDLQSGITFMGEI
jgi:hypothetical protein